MFKNWKGMCNSWTQQFLRTVESNPVDWNWKDTAMMDIPGLILNLNMRMRVRRMLSYKIYKHIRALKLKFWIELSFWSTESLESFVYLPFFFSSPRNFWLNISICNLLDYGEICQRHYSEIRQTCQKTSYTT